MTNYSCYPKWRDYYGIIIEFDDYHYSWSENSKAQRRYLLESSYCDHAKRIYVCNNTVSVNSETTKNIHGAHLQKIYYKQGHLRDLKKQSM